MTKMQASLAAVKKCAHTCSEYRNVISEGTVMYILCDVCFTVCKSVKFKISELVEVGCFEVQDVPGERICDELFGTEGIGR